MRKFLYLGLCLLCFSVGAYVWKVKNTGLSQAAHDVPSPARQDLSPGAVVVEVGTERITQEDVDWEYNFLTEGVFDKETLTPIPDLGDRYHQELGSLRKNLISNIIERKLLYLYIQQDRDFGFNDPKRYSDCLTSWQQSLAGANSPSLQGKGRDRLKARLCERSILDQYLKERLFAAIHIEDNEIVEYYKNHASEYKMPERVEIRQVLLPNEDEAKKVRAQINAHNFAEMARTHSIAPEAKNGGRLGPFAKGGMPAVFEVAFHMSKGQISDVMKSNYGYHIVTLLEKFPKKDLSLNEAKPKILVALRKQKEEEAYGKWVEKALASINVTTPKAVF